MINTFQPYSCHSCQNTLLLSHSSGATLFNVWKAVCVGWFMFYGQKFSSVGGVLFSNDTLWLEDHFNAWGMNVTHLRRWSHALGFDYKGSSQNHLLMNRGTIKQESTSLLLHQRAYTKSCFGLILSQEQWLKFSLWSTPGPVTQMCWKKSHGV